jgi:hypothetical protein
MDPTWNPCRQGRLRRRAVRSEPDRDDRRRHQRRPALATDHADRWQIEDALTWRQRPEREGRAVTTATITATTAAERELRVAEAIHSGEMEGLHVDPSTRADAQEYVAGRITSDELVARARARYGLG